MIPCICLNFRFVALKFVMSVQAPRTRAVKNVRRHACSSIIKMCRDYPHLVLVRKCSSVTKSLVSISAGFYGISPMPTASVFLQGNIPAAQMTKCFISFILPHHPLPPSKIFLWRKVELWSHELNPKWMRRRKQAALDSFWGNCLLIFSFITCGSLSWFLSWRR